MKLTAAERAALRRTWGKPSGLKVQGDLCARAGSDLAPKDAELLADLKAEFERLWDADRPATPARTDTADLQGGF